MMFSKAILTFAVFVFVAATSPGYAGVLGGALCKEKKAKASGKKAADLTKAFGKNIKKTDTAKLAEGISKARSKFTKAFTRAEAKGGCNTTGDAPAIEAKVDAAVADLMLKLTNICGDNSRAGIEQCDGPDASECPGLCLANCTCPEPICNNGSKEVGEECDPAGSTVDCDAGEICGGFCDCVPNLPCDCGYPDPTLYVFTDLSPVPDSNCGAVDGDTLTELKCMGLYIGGGAGGLPVPNMVPDYGQTKFNITQCTGTDLTLAHTTKDQVGSRHCSEGKKCAGGPNDGGACIRDRDCEGFRCTPQCWFGSYLAVLDVELPPISTCISNEFSQDALGGLDCGTGKALTRLPLDSRVHMTLHDQSPSTPGHNPCPICVGGTLNVPNSGVCEGGPNNGLSCMPMGTQYDLHDCCAGGLNNTKPCADDDDCPGSACVPGCSSYPTSLDCPPHPIGDVGGLLLTVDLTSEADIATADENGRFCGWCRDIEVESTRCFEGDEDDGGSLGCPDSSVIACRPATFYGPDGGDPADMAECGDPLPCRTDDDCKAPYETCTQRNPGAWRDATVRNVFYQGTRPGDLRDHNPHSSVGVSAFCIPANFVESIDAQSDLGGPGGLSLVGEARLSPSGAFIDMTLGLLD